VLRTGGFEDIGGYARAVRAANVVAVSATAATGPDGVALHPGDAYAQTREAIARAVDALGQLDASIGDVIRTRVYLAPDADWRKAIEAHREAFSEVTPANTTVFVAGFIPPDVLVEIELDAVVDRS
jgi:enamine deaminase RidA (YjgF/YER057c/UK114 family)